MVVSLMFYYRISDKVLSFLHGNNMAFSLVAQTVILSWLAIVDNTCAQRKLCSSY